MKKTEGNASLGLATAAPPMRAGAIAGLARRAFVAMAMTAIVCALSAGESQNARAAGILRASPGEAASPAVVQAYRAFGQTVAKASGESFFVDPATGADAVPAREVLERFQRGRIDVAPIDLTLFPDAFAFGLLMRDLALAATDPATLASAGTEFVLFHCPPCFDEFRKANVIPLAAIGAPPTYLASRSRIASLDEMAAKRIGGGGTYAMWITRLGGSAVMAGPAPFGRATAPADALDGRIATLAEIIGARLWTTMPHVTNLAIGTAGPIALFNVGKPAWDDLGLGDRAALITAAAHGLAATVRAALASEAADRAQLLGRAVSFHAPNPALAARHATIRNESVAAVALAAERRGLTAAGELVDRYDLLVRRWSALIARLGANAEGIEDLLQQEIYGKIDPRAYGG